MAKKINIWEQKDFGKLSAGLEKNAADAPQEIKSSAPKRKPRSATYQSKEAKKIARWKEGLKEIVKKPMMIEKHIHIRMKRYCVDKEINIFDYTCDLIDRDLKKNGY